MTDPHIEIYDGAYGKRLSLRGPWRHSYAEFMKSHTIRELSVVASGVGSFETLDFLAEVPWLLSFQLIDITRQEVQGIHYLHELRHLYMGDYSRQPIDFSAFPNLTKCYMEFTKNRISVAGCEHLESLSVQHFSYKNLSKLVSLRKLRTLEVLQGSLGDINDIVAFKDLETLALTYLRNLSDISVLGNLPKLKKLDLQASKNFGSIEIVRKLPNLVELTIANCGNIESLAPLRGCPKLEVLRAENGTTILDGDLTPLLDLPNLRLLWLGDRKYYNLKVEEIPLRGHR